MAEVPYIPLDQAKIQLKSANDFFLQWRYVPLPEKLSVVTKALSYFDSVIAIQNKAEIAKEITMQMGKPYKQSLKEVATMLSLARDLMSLAPAELETESLESTETSRKIIIKEAIGPVFLLSPYNYPLISVIGSLIPAVLCGNPVIIKPSPYTPLTASHFSKAFQFAGVPHLVQDSLLEISNIASFISQKEIAYVNLTGQSEAGRSLYQQIANKSFIDVGLFLSANNGVYIAADANMQRCVSSIIRNSLENAGQSGYRDSRIFVHKSLHKEFLDLASTLVQSFTIGDPMDEFTTLGPITEPDSIDALRQQIDEAIAADAQVVCGGFAVNDENGKGRFFEPTILVGVDDSLSIMVRLR